MDENSFRPSDGCGAAPGGAYISVGLRSGGRYPPLRPTPAEARLAADLAAGLTLAQSAGRHGIAVKSARTYLERVFQKTGTHQQSQLVAMLKTMQPLVAPSVQ